MVTIILNPISFNDYVPIYPFINDKNNKKRKITHIKKNLTRICPVLSFDYDESPENSQIIITKSISIKLIKLLKDHPNCPIAKKFIRLLNIEFNDYKFKVADDQLYIWSKIDKLSKKIKINNSHEIFIKKVDSVDSSNRRQEIKVIITISKKFISPALLISPPNSPTI